MKENINIFRTNNPNFFKSMHKKTIVANNIESNNKDINNKDVNNKDVNNQNSSNNQNNSNNQNVNKKNLNKEDLNKKKSKIIKTQKLMFKEKDNSFKTVYYPELQGMNLNKIKEELRQEEAEEDFGTIIPKQNINTSFTIEEFEKNLFNNFSRFIMMKC